MRLRISPVKLFQNSIQRWLEADISSDTNVPTGRGILGRRATRSAPPCPDFSEQQQAEA